MKIHQSAEDYLESIFTLREKQGFVRSIDIANHLGVSKPSVSVAMKKLRESGCIAMDQDSHITLLPAGEEIARKIYERHEILTRFFTALGVSHENASADACRVEHVLSQETFDCIKKKIVGSLGAGNPADLLPGDGGYSGRSAVRSDAERDERGRSVGSGEGTHLRVSSGEVSEVSYGTEERTDPEEVQIEGGTDALRVPAGAGANDTRGEGTTRGEEAGLRESTVSLGAQGEVSNEEIQRALEAAQVTPKQGTVAYRIQEIAMNEYGIETFVVPDDEWDRILIKTT